MDTINRRLAAQDVVDPYVIEIQAPGGIFALIETRCKNIKSTKDKIQALAKKYGYAAIQKLIRVDLRCQNRIQVQLPMNFLNIKALSPLSHKNLPKILMLQLNSQLNVVQMTLKRQR